jgi:PAS domain S-box-containing protein
MEFRFSNKQGEWRLFEVITRPTFDEKGNLVCLIFYLNDITKRRIAEEELKRSEKRFRTIVENSRDIIFRYRLAPSQAFDYISPAVEAVTGHTQEEFYRDSGLILKFIDPDDRHLVEGLTTEKLVLNKPFTLRWKLDNGKTICTEQSTIAVSDERGGIVAVEGIARDVTLRMQMEDRLKKSLKEKEVLLTEIHHRVKNNMQIISSLLSIQSQNISDPSIMNLFTDTQNRIHSIALIHNIMYKSKNLGSVDFEEYVQDLASILLRSLAVDREKIKLHIDAIDVRLDINRAIPCGLIINEIVSNSIKHAFPGERTGDVRISFSGEDPDRYTLLVRDNGIGIDGNIDLDRTDSIGLTIVRDLTLQLKGTLGIHNDNGTEIRVEFPKQRNPAE